MPNRVIRRRPFWRALLTLVAVTGALVVVIGAQQPTAPPQSPAPPEVTFRVDANFVEVNAVVTDERGQIVEGLSKDDFEVYEDGKLQTPSVFAFVDLPPAPAPAAQSALTVEPDVRSTRRGFDGRIYVLVLDDLHTMTLRSQLVREAAKRFIREHLAPGDLAAVVHTSSRSDATQELTGSRRLLTEAVDRFMGQKLPSATAERLAAHLLDTANQDPNDTSTSRSPAQDPIADPLDFERGHTARRSLELVKNVAGWMADLRGRRKALVLFSEGIDYDIYDVFNSRSAGMVMQEARDAIAAAQRAGVSIYAVDPRGLTVGDESLASSAVSSDPQIREISPGAFGRELLLSQESLIAMAEETGGYAAVRTNDIAGALARIAAENSTYYLLGYHSDASRSPGKFRKIEVRVKKPGVRVRARRGYVPLDPKEIKAREAAVSANTSSALRAAMSSPVPLGDVPLRLFATPFKGSGRNGSVLLALEIDGPSLTFEEREGFLHAKFEVSIAAMDYQGRVRDSYQQGFDIKFRPDIHKAVTNQGGIRILARLDLPPARYQVRVGVYDAVGARAGALPYDLEVPDYSRIAFSLSGLVLATTQPGGITTMKPDPVLNEVLPLPPVAVRVFQRQDTIAFVTELYDNSSKLGHTVDFVTTVKRADNGDVVFEKRDERSVKGGNQRDWYKLAIPAADFPPGRYVLGVRATSRVGSQEAVREVPFEVALAPRGIGAN